MSRPLRIEYEGAWYHVMNRGTGRRDIFHTDQHRLLFLELLNQVHQKFKIEIHAYCLMRNHYHLLMRTPLANLQKAMRHLNGIYALRYNRDRKTDGPLFRGRYKAIIVEEEDYLLRLSRYIHWNPVAANVSRKPEDYKWSSYLFYIRNLQKPNWLFLNEILLRFGESEQKSKYRLFTEEGIDEEINNYYKILKKLPILGKESFVKQIADKFFVNTPISQQISECKIVKNLNIPSVENVMGAVADYFNIDGCVLKDSRRGRSNPPRTIAIFLSVEVCQQTLTTISKKFGSISYAGISNIHRKVLAYMTTDNHLKTTIEILRKKLLQNET